MAGTVLYDEIFETDNYLGNQGKDDLVINDLAFLLGTDRQGIRHDVIDEAWIVVGVSVDSAKSSFADDAA